MKASATFQVVVLCGLLPAMQAHAADLYNHDSWAALASDRTAHKVGDSLTVIVYESTTAVNSANTSSKRSKALGGHASANGFGGAFDGAANLGIDTSSDITGTTGRTGGMIAQLSVVVDAVLPNGDLHVSGAQLLNINGEKTKIAVAGRVRLADISSANTVLSSRLADAAIDYDGSGFVSRSTASSVIGRVFDWLGL